MIRLRRDHLCPCTFIHRVVDGNNRLHLLLVRRVSLALHRIVEHLLRWVDPEGFATAGAGGYGGYAGGFSAANVSNVETAQDGTRTLTVTLPSGTGSRGAEEMTNTATITDMSLTEPTVPMTLTSTGAPRRNFWFRRKPWGQS